MQHWKPLEPRRKPSEDCTAPFCYCASKLILRLHLSPDATNYDSNLSRYLLKATSASRAVPEHSEGELLVVQEGWTQSTRFRVPDKLESGSSHGRHFRTFESPAGPPSWLGNENKKNTAPYIYSSDEEGDLVINKIPLTRPSPQQASIQLDENGWYDWDVGSTDTYQNDSKQPASDPFITDNGPRTPEDPSSLGLHCITLSDPATFEAGLEAVDISFLEEFDNSLEAAENLDSVSSVFQSETTAPASPRVFLTQSVSPVEPLRLPTSTSVDTTGAHRAVSVDEFVALQSASEPADRQLEVTTRDELTEVDLDARKHGTGSLPTLVRLSPPASSSRSYHLDAEDTSAGTDPDVSGMREDLSQTLQNLDEMLAGDDDINDVIPPSVPTVEHSREQSRRLRLYSTLYADFARDPWKWHERRDIVREMFPSLESESSAGDPPPTYGELEDQANDTAQIQQQLNDYENGGRSDSQRSRRNEHMQDEERRATSFIEPPSSEPSTDGVRYRYMPLEGQQYCFKCRRHFKNTWRMQKHLSDSRIHPYYCQVCTVDYSSFKQLYMVRFCIFSDVCVVGAKC